jgi:predicted ATPase
LDGHGCLLTGENGTGKSTVIDAFLSLLVHAMFDFSRSVNRI